MQSMSKIFGSRSQRMVVLHQIRRELGLESSSSTPVQHEVDSITGIATISLNRPPTNILNMEMMQQLISSLKESEQNKCRGLILTSTSDKIFTAGLDIKEMYKPDVDRLKEYWRAFQDLWLTWYGSNIPTAALINGHSPAGGCVISTCCEYRVMLPNFTIGLNETQFGLVAPKFVRASFINALHSRRIAEMALIQGKMFTSQEALKGGLVDELAATKEVGLEKCSKILSTFAKVDPAARSLTKLKFRGSDLEDLRREKDKDLEGFVAMITDKYTQQKLEKYLQQIQKKKNK